MAEWPGQLRDWLRDQNLREIADSIGLPNPGLPHFGPYVLPVGILAGTSVLGYLVWSYLPSHRIIIARPPAGWGGVVVRGSAQKLERQKKIDGKPQTQRITNENGTTEEVPAMETITEIDGPIVGEIINLPGYYVDHETGEISPNGTIYNPKTGKDEPINATGQQKNTEPRNRLNILTTVKHSLEEVSGIYYIGKLPVLDKVPELDIFWAEWPKEGEESEFLRRREARRPYNRLTIVTMGAFIETAEERGGYPWAIKVIIYWRISNLRKAWKLVPDSAEQAKGLIVSGITSFVQRVFILQYEGCDKRNMTAPPGGKLNPLDPKDIKGAFPLSNEELSRQLMAYLEGLGTFAEIRNLLGREVIDIAIPDKTLNAPYADVIAEIRTAELRKQTTIIESEAIQESMKNIAEGMGAQLTAIKNAGEAGKMALLSGLFNKEGEKPTDMEKLTAATLYGKDLTGGGWNTRKRQ